MYLKLFLLSILLLIIDKSYSDNSIFQKQKITDKEIKAIILAIKDEIYTLEHQKTYFDIGADKVPIYINPNIENNLIWFVYKLMPHGEIFRAAYVNKDGLAFLLGDPHNGFPPTQGASMKTVYLKDEDVIEMKTTWEKTYFSININPSNKEIEDVKKRQEIRFKHKYDY